MGKTCTKCGLTKPNGSFSTEKYRGTLRVRPDCKKCRASSQRARHAKPENRTLNNAYMRAYQARKRAEKYAKLRVLKEANPCKDCGKFYPSYVMDFDHLDPNEKIEGIGYLVSTAHSWAFVEAEIAKCELVCACCHRLRTYRGVRCKQGRQMKHHILILNAIKTTHPCLDCGSHFKPSQMDFDHWDPTQKIANVALLVGKPAHVLAEELRKCHLVCANCHRIREATGQRPSGNHDLAPDFLRLLGSLPYPSDKRTTAPRQKRGRYLDQPAFRPWHCIAGTSPDIDVAIKFGVSASAVFRYRKRQNIPAFDPRGRGPLPAFRDTQKAKAA